MYIREKVPCTTSEEEVSKKSGSGRSSRRSDTSRQAEGRGAEREGGERWIGGVRVDDEHHRLSVS
jgi:hypothetical protein